MNEKAEEHARDVALAITNLISASISVSRNSAPYEIVTATHEQLVAKLTRAFRSAGYVQVEYD